MQRMSGSEAAGCLSVLGASIGWPPSFSRLVVLGLG